MKKVEELENKKKFQKRSSNTVATIINSDDIDDLTKVFIENKINQYLNDMFSEEGVSNNGINKKLKALIDKYNEEYFQEKFMNIERSFETLLKKKSEALNETLKSSLDDVNSNYHLDYESFRIKIINIETKLNEFENINNIDKFKNEINDKLRNFEQNVIKKDEINNQLTLIDKHSLKINKTEKIINELLNQISHLKSTLVKYDSQNAKNYHDNSAKIEDLNNRLIGINNQIKVQTNQNEQFLKINVAIQNFEEKIQEINNRIDLDINKLESRVYLCQENYKAIWESIKLLNS